MANSPRNELFIRTKMFNAADYLYLQADASTLDYEGILYHLPSADLARPWAVSRNELFQAMSPLKDHSSILHQTHLGSYRYLKHKSIGSRRLAVLANFPHTIGHPLTDRKKWIFRSLRPAIGLNLGSTSHRTLHRVGLGSHVRIRVLCQNRLLVHLNA